MAGGFLSLTALRAEGCGIALTGDEHKVSVTDSPFCVIWHDRHSADWLAALATPYPGCAGLLHGKACHTILRSLRFLTNRVPLPPLFRGQNKTSRNTLFISRTTISTGYSATVEVLHRTSKWGEVRRLACPLKRFPFAAPPNCGGSKGTGFIGDPRDPRIQ